MGPITFIVLAILGVALIAVLKAYFATPGPKPAQATATVTPQVRAASDPTVADPWDARPGDVISISGAAEDYSDVDFPVDRRSSYESGNRRWVDLSGEFRGQRVYLEVYRYPQKDYIGLVSPRKLTLADIGMPEDRLVELDNGQDQTQSIDWNGKRWYYESSREIAYRENETAEPEGLYRWTLGEKDGPNLLIVEKWEGEPFEARLGRRFNATDISVYRAA